MRIGDFEIVVCSDIDYEDLIAEISYQGEFLAVVDQETRAGQYDIELQSRPAGGSWRLKLSELERILFKTRKKLDGLKRTETSSNEANDQGTYNPNCYETYATFRVLGDKLDPGVVTRMLGIEPSFFRRKGDTLGRPAKPIASPTGIWALESEHQVKSTVLEEHISYLLSRLRNLGQEFQNYVAEQDLKLDMHCYWMSATGQGGPTVSPATLERIANFGATLDLDIYYAGEDA